MRDFGKLLKQRDAASDWISHGRWATIFLAVFGCGFAVLEAGLFAPVVTLVRITLYLGLGIAGFFLASNRPWTARLVLTLLALTLVLSAAMGTLISGIPFRLAVVIVCAKGALAVFRYQELHRLISEPSSPAPEQNG